LGISRNVDSSSDSVDWVEFLAGCCGSSVRVSGFKRNSIIFDVVQNISRPSSVASIMSGFRRAVNKLLFRKINFLSELFEVKVFQDGGDCKSVTGSALSLVSNGTVTSFCPIHISLVVFSGK